MHVWAREEVGGGALDHGSGCALAVRGRPRDHRVARGERVLAFGEPGAAGELGGHRARIRNLRRPFGRPHEGVELASAEAMLGRSRANDLPPGCRVDPVSLAHACVVSDGLTPRVTDVDAGGSQLALALLDLAPTGGELAQHAWRDLLDLGHSVAHRTPAHPRQALAHRRAKVRLVQKPGGLGVPVDLRSIERRPAPVSATRHVCRHDMRVQLGILGTTHAMAIGGRHESFAGLAPHAATTTTHATGLALQVSDGGVDRRLVRLHERPGQRPFADGKEHADRLRRRERQNRRRPPSSGHQRA